MRHTTPATTQAEPEPRHERDTVNADDYAPRKKSTTLQRKDYVYSDYGTDMLAIILLVGGGGGGG